MGTYVKKAGGSKMKYLFYILLATVQIISVTSLDHNKTYYSSYKCQEGKCARTSYPLAEAPSGQGPFRTEIEHSTMAACRLSCDHFGALWPVPTGQINLGSNYVSFHPSQFVFVVSTVSGEAGDFLNETQASFMSNIRRMLDHEDDPIDGHDYDKINVFINVNSSDLTLDWFTDESYTLEVAVNGTGKANDGTIQIFANTVYGASHGMETLLQLTAPVIKTWHRQGLVILQSAMITDAPVFAHRGLTLDTSRNFVPLIDILRTIDGLSACKMNVLHWHATDSQSFPLEVKRVPSITLYGAYAPDKIYSTSDMQSVVAYGRRRGVRVIVELDAPSHSGAGWEWGELEGLGSLAVCLNAQPWRKSCIQPPCGQLNPVNPNVYEILRKIYKDFIDVWGSNEVFHMGGDEVFLPCWNSTTEITDEMMRRGMGLNQSDFLQLWSEFQASVLKIVDEERGPGSSNISAILWTSDLTNPATIERYLDKDRYVIQTWVPSSSYIPNQLLDLGYRLIMTTKNAWYLDHGFWGNTKYYTWRDVYLNRIPRRPGVLGGEVAMWGELVDGLSLDPRIWPRTAAAAERLWSDSPKMTTAKAEPRLHNQRDRLAIRGIRPEPIAPEWCAQHDGQCQ